MAEDTKQATNRLQEKRIGAMMTWVRLLLPLAIAALGWYIGQTVGNLNQRLTNLEIADNQLREEFIEHRSQSQQFQQDILRRLSRDELTIEDMVRMSQFMASEAEHDRRLERLENRLDDALKGNNN